MHAADVDTAWISALLKIPEGGVEGVAVTPVGTGQVADTYRVAFRVGGAPRSLIAKMTSDDEVSRRTGVSTRDYLREVRFYSEIAPTLSVNLPTCHHAEVDAAGVEFALVMDDLAPAVPGDQLGGATIEQAHAALRQASRLHLDTWKRPDLRSLPWLATPAIDIEQPPDFTPVLGKYLSRYPRHDTGDFTKVARPFFANLPAYLRLGADASPWSLIHADFRLDNMLFDQQAGAKAVTIVDWQTVQSGSPMIDVAYFITTSFAPDDRRTHEARLVHAYHQNLVTAGVTGYPAEQCWDDYRLHVLFALWMAVVSAVVVKRTDRGDAMFSAMADRALAAATDHDSLSLLTRPQRGPAPLRSHPVSTDGGQ